jgi:glycosyltransferase 2 family protein
LTFHYWIKEVISSKLFRAGIGLLIAILSLYLATRDVTLTGVVNIIEGANLTYVVWAFASTLGIIFTRVWRWKILMGKPGFRITPRRTVMALLAGQALNLIYPARIGDVSRAYLVDQSGSNRAFMLGTVVLEKLLDSLAYVFLFAILVIIFPLPNWINSSGYMFAILTALSLGVVFLLAYRIEWFTGWMEWGLNRLPSVVKGRIQGWIFSGLKSLEILKSKWSLIQLFLLSMIVWIIPIITNHLALLALEIHLPLTASLLTMIVLQASVAIPSVPGRIGLFEYLCVLSLSIFGIAEGPAFTYGVLLHVIALLPSTLAGILFFWILSTKGNNRSLTNAIIFDDRSDLSPYDRSK